jgi:hypothetical protein
MAASKYPFCMMLSENRLKRYYRIGFAAILLLHCVLQWPHIFLDYWNDELYTLQHFGLQPFAQIVRDYHVPNNHVFFSLFLHAVAKLLDIQSIQDALNNTALLRFVLLCISGLTIFFTYKFTDLISGKPVALLSILLLVTTIPFYNYALQVRGYTLSMCLYAGLAWAIAYSYVKWSWASLVAISLTTAFCLYTLPSNIYFIIAAIIGLLIVWLVNKSGQSPFPLVKMLQVQFLIGSGIIIAFLLYLPVRSQMATISAFNSPVSGTGSIANVMPIVAYHILSGRHLLLALVSLGLFVSLGKPQERLMGINTTVLLATVFIVPFLLSDIRHDNAPHRIFITGLPVLVSLAALLIGISISWLKHWKLQCIAFGTISVYCLFTCIGQIQKTERQAVRDIANGLRCGDLYFQYNLHFYHPRQDASLYLTKYHSSSIPLIEACGSGAEILKYLRLSGEYVPGNLTLSQAVKQFKTIDVLIENPHWLRDSLSSVNYLKWQQQQLLPGPRNVHFIRLTHYSLD